MLSPEENNEIKNKLKKYIKITYRKVRNSLKKRLKKQLKEHEYATTNELFEPLPYIFYFLNRTTSS